METIETIHMKKKQGGKTLAELTDFFSATRELPMSRSQYSRRVSPSDAFSNSIDPG
jgi:hypothetical protein